MRETAKEIAERLAGPHEGHRRQFDAACASVGGQDPCDCPRRERVAGIEAALRDAEKRGRTAGVEAEFQSHEAEVLELTRTQEHEVAEQVREAEEPWRRFAWLAHGHVGLYGDDGEMQCSVNGAADFKRDPSERLIEHATKALQDTVAEARRQGREEMRERAAVAAYDRIFLATLDCGCHDTAAEAIRALPLDEPGEKGR